MRVRELRLTYEPRSDLEAFNDAPNLPNPRAVSQMLARILESEVVEVFIVLCLTVKHRPIAWHEVSRGTLYSTLVHPRELFKVAFLANAASVVLAHNHPSGDPCPSADDRALTRRLVAAGELLGVDVLDHIIIGHDGHYFSFKESGGLTSANPSPT